MDAQHSREIYRHLEKQGELLEEARKSIIYELQKLAVEQEMLMRKSYDVRMQQEHARKNMMVSKIMQMSDKQLLQMEQQ